MPKRNSKSVKPSSLTRQDRVVVEQDGSYRKDRSPSGDKPSPPASEADYVNGRRKSGT